MFTPPMSPTLRSSSPSSPRMTPMTPSSPKESRKVEWATLPEIKLSEADKNRLTDQINKDFRISGINEVSLIAPVMLAEKILFANNYYVVCRTSPETIRRYSTPKSRTSMKLSPQIYLLRVSEVNTPLYSLSSTRRFEIKQIIKVGESIEPIESLKYQIGNSKKIKVVTKRKIFTVEIRLYGQAEKVKED